MPRMTFVTMFRFRFSFTILFCFSHCCLTKIQREEYKFYKAFLCDLKDRMNHNCSMPMTEIKTFNECVVKCERDNTCVGASSNGSHGVCVHHFMCDKLSKCVTKELTHKYVSKNCAHDGVWNPDTLTCSCRNGWIGKNCLDLPEKCPDLITYGYTSRRMYLAIQLPQSPVKSPTPTPVYCYISESPSLWYGLHMMLNNGNVDFNRTWEDYKNGFYVDSQNFWIGLDSWHFLTKAGYTQLTVALTMGNVFRKYHAFKVLGESQHYAFTYDSTQRAARHLNSPYENDFTDCLGPLTNKPFVTFDRNSDCARKVGSGWWHDTDQCTTSPSYCNVLGKTPKNWNADIPEYQRMRVDGFDPDVMEASQSDVGSIFYLRRE